MTGNWIGAVLIVAGCGGCGFSAAAAGKRETKLLGELSRTLLYMENDLQYNFTPLPELSRQASGLCSGALREVFANLCRELDWQTQPDAAGCMAQALEKSSVLPVSLRRLLHQLGSTLGRFDLPGQLRELEALRARCESELERSRQDQALRLRSFRTLGLCTGAALAILLL